MTSRHDPSLVDPRQVSRSKQSRVLVKKKREKLLVSSTVSKTFETSPAPMVFNAFKHNPSVAHMPQVFRSQCQWGQFWLKKSKTVIFLDAFESLS